MTGSFLLLLSSAKKGKIKRNKKIAQRSVLKPPIFLIFINDLSYFTTQNHSPMYADDTNMITRNH